jgi:hypothetical protein
MESARRSIGPKEARDPRLEDLGPGCAERPDPLRATEAANPPFTTLARPMQEGLAFRSKGSIGVVGRPRV